MELDSPSHRSALIIQKHLTECEIHQSQKNIPMSEGPITILILTKYINQTESNWNLMQIEQHSNVLET